jgi:glycosyltransferase involved in cell wall biosynthesis
MKKIIILMATYNGEKFVEEQIKSILSQTYKNWILHIHDDGSKDDTIKIIKKYSDSIPNIMFLDDGVDCGGAKKNFKYLMNHIENDFDFVMFSDQDDVWLKDKIENTLNLMLEVEAKELDRPILVHTDLIVVDSELNFISESMRKSQRLDILKQNNLKRMCTDSIISGCTVMINKSLFSISKDIPKEAIMHDTWIPLMALKHNGIIVYLDKGTLYYRQHDNNTTGSKEIGILFYFNRMLRLGKVVDEYKAMYVQCKRAGIKISWIIFVLNRVMAVGKKIFGGNI